jgi:tetratricopeptide (TPR) repeat protein
MPKPFAVLRYLVEHAGRVVTQDELLAAIWPDTYVQPEVLRRYILEIRRALGDAAGSPQFVQTLPKRGYQFIAPVSDDAIPRVGGNLATVNRLVGRRSALADLERCLAVALEGRRQMVFVVGEPGIGKTSVVDEFQRATVGVAGVSVARGQSVEGFGGKEAYYPLLEAIGQLARSPSRSTVVDTLGAHAPTWLIQFPSLIRPEQQAALQREILGATRERMVRELCEALEILTETVPLVLILEDLHWVDHSTLDVISAIARRREPAKLLVLGTFRPADLILFDSPLKALRQDLLLHHLSHELELERLHEPDVADYIATAFAPGDVPRGLAAVIYRHSDGNPLFMTAMLDHLVQCSVITRGDAGWTMTVPLDQADPGVPETLKQMLEMQLQDSSEAEQQLLKCASVAGQHFTAWAVATMLASERSDTEDMCEALADRQQFLLQAGTRELPNGVSTAEYRFRHALYREVLYRKLNPKHRSTFHRRLAEGLEGLRSPTEPDMAAEIALHFEEGHEYERAVRYLMAAAENATRRYAHSQSVAILEHARTLVPRLADEPALALDLEILEKIGNSHYALGNMEQSANSYRSLATRAAASYVLAAQADRLMRLAHAAESIPFFVRAIEIDPNFAMAYISLSRIYSNLGEAARAKEYAQLAYDRRAQVGERDRLSITYQYHYEVTGDQARANEALEAWKALFLLEFQPVNSLALIHNFLGDFDRAITEGHEAVTRNPSHGYPYSNLAHAYRGAGQFDAARHIAEQAVALDIETLPTRRLLYQLAVITGDDGAAMRHLEWSRDKPREFDMISARAQITAWHGKVREARQLYEEAVHLADVRNLPEVGTSHLARATSMELAYGNTERAIQQARRVLARNPGYDARLRAALVLAATGFTCEASTIADELAAANPDNTFINAVLVPVVRAAIELRRERPDDAIEQLRVVAPYELGFIAAFAPIYVRGQAYLLRGSAPEAGAEFQRILDHRGADPFSAFHAAALVGLARARRMAGEMATAVEAYEQFVAGWAKADDDVPVLIEARAELAGLTRAHQESLGRL